MFIEKRDITDGAPISDAYETGEDGGLPKCTCFNHQECNGLDTITTLVPPTTLPSTTVIAEDQDKFDYLID